jgi:hypothetical protein
MHLLGSSYGGQTGFAKALSRAKKECSLARYDLVCIFLLFLPLPLSGSRSSAP